MKALFILGKGRSGTTLVGQVLGMLPGFFYAGEVNLLWQTVLDRQPCSCGAEPRECPIWSQILNRTLQLDHARVCSLSSGYPSATGDDLDRYTDDMLASQQIWSSGRVALRRLTGRLDDKDIRELASLSALYRSMAAATGARVIVSSAKQLTDPGVLRLIPELEPSVLHIVRDPRGVAYSWQRRNPVPSGTAIKGGLPRYMQQKTLRDSALTWVAKNVGIEVLRHFGRLPGARIRYEDLTRAPASTAHELAASLDEHVASADVTREPQADVVNFQGLHVIAGNPSRFQHGPTGVVSDERWRQALTPAEVAVVTGVSWPLMLWYGYRLYDRPKP